MADEKLNTGPAENISPEAAEPIATPEQAAASEPQQEQTGPAIPEPGDVVVSFDKINELMAEKRQNARAEVEKAETPEASEAAAPGETPQPANTEEPKKPRRGRPPKAEKAATENQKSEKSAGARKGRPPKADKAAPDKPKPSKRDKVSRSDGKAPDAKEPIKPAQDTALKETAAVEQTAPEPTTPPRPVEEGKLVYLKLSEVHPFHTFRPHPFKVRDDAKMQEIVASIRVNGVMVPGLARPEKDGNGYEIVAGHRRTHGSELAGLEEMPFIVREMTDHEAVQAMKDSNKQRDGMLPSELAALLELEVEDIKHQGGRLKGVAEGDVGKRSVEIVGEAHEMNYKKVMRYLRLNSLVPELLDITAAWLGGDSENAELAAQYCRTVYEAGFSPICPPLYLPLFLNDAVPEEHKSGIDMSRDLLRRSHVLVVCGHSMTESMKNDIAVAQRLGITATTLEGILTVKGQGRR